MTPVPTFRELAEELQRCMAGNNPVLADAAWSDFSERLAPATMLAVYEALEAYGHMPDNEGELARKMVRLLDGVTDNGET